jgi:Ca2+-binding RTX toxin-like protein
VAQVNFSGRKTGISLNPFFDDPTAFSLVSTIANGYRFNVLDGTTRKKEGTVDAIGVTAVDSKGQPSAGTITKLVYSTKDGTSVWDNVSIQASTWNIFSQKLTQVDLMKELLRGSDVITGSAKQDFLWSYAGNDTINGGLGDDWLVGGFGNDSLNGGKGTDLLSYYDHVKAVKVVLAESGNGTVKIGSEVDRYTSIEDLEGGYGADKLTGNSKSNTIYAYYGNDTVSGLGGNDTLFGWYGNDALNGGAGNDLLSGFRGNDRMTGGTGIDTFEFYSDDGGKDVITDFSAKGSSADILSFSKGLFANKAAFLAASTDTAGGLLITYAAGSILLVGIDKAEAQNIHFDFFV